MAKGVEDTTFYVYNRFISANEVGGSVKVFGIAQRAFHAGNVERLENSPDSMLTTSTHDTKRSEDVRARLNVLSEMPTQWASMVRRWQRMNARYKRTLEDGRVAPDGNEEYLLYQTIAGTWPWQMQGSEDRKNYLQRMQQYASKALSEAKVNLSWINPDPEYVKAVQGFLEDILIASGRRKETRFVESLGSLMPQLKIFGALNSLSQLVLKIASPGVPDFYQGNELWELTLVDPDNRQPVDYDIRNRHLEALDRMLQSHGAARVCDELMGTIADGRIKLWTMWRALALRKNHTQVFERGEYIALQSGKPDRSENVVAFARHSRESGKTIIAVVPRFACSMGNGKAEMPLQDAWGKATIVLPEALTGLYTNVFTDEQVGTGEGGSLRLSSVFSRFPVALLVSGDA